MSTPRPIAILCGVILCAAALCGEPTAPPPPVANPAQAPRAEQAFLLRFIALEEEKGLVRGCGTAFPIAAHQLLTAEHCIHNEVHLSIKVGDDYLDCKVVKCDDEMDVAVIGCDEATFTPLELTTDEITEGKIVGCPDGDPVQSVAFINVDIHIKQTWLHTVFTTKVFTFGSSGSPLLGLNNKCCGMAVVMMEGRNGNFAGYVPSRRIYQFLNEPERKEPVSKTPQTSDKPAPKTSQPAVENPPAKIEAPKVEPKKSGVQFR